MCDGHDHERPSASDSVRNLLQPMPLGRKVRLLVRNQLIKLRTGATCCGHDGEPGC